MKYSAARLQLASAATDPPQRLVPQVPILIFVWLPIIYYQHPVGAGFRAALQQERRLGDRLFICCTSSVMWPTTSSRCQGAGVHSRLISTPGPSLPPGGDAVRDGWRATSVMTDLIQGITLLLVGMGLFFMASGTGGLARFRVGCRKPPSHLLEFNR